MAFLEERDDCATQHTEDTTWLAQVSSYAAPERIPIEALKNQIKHFCDTNRQTNRITWIIAAALWPIFYLQC